MQKTSGLSLMELMVATFILSIGTLAAIGSFKYITTSIQHSKSRTLSSNLAQEQIEKLKNLSYYTLLVTTGTPYSDNRFSPAISYDLGNYPPQTIVEGGLTFTRATRVDFAYQNGSVISTAPWTTDDTALKQITVFVIWKEGADWKYQQVQSLYANPAATPLSAAASGWVKTSAAGNAPIPGALVQVIDNANWYANSDNLGNYRFSVSEGSYTLQASSNGFYTSTTPGYQSFTSGVTTPVNFTLTPISSGTVTGYIYKNDHMVISQVVASTIDATTGNDYEYVDLYNPTTNSIFIGDQMNNGVGGNPPPNIWIVTWDNGNSASQHHLYYANTTIPANGHYLISNSGTGGTPSTACGPIPVSGMSVAADACWRSFQASAGQHVLSQTDAGGVSIATTSGYVAATWPATRIDSVGWNQKAFGGNPAPANAVEGTAITPLGAPNGLTIGEIIARMTDPGNITSGYGMGYDTDDNHLNFLDSLFIPGPPNNTGTIRPPMTGTPDTGAMVSMNDLLTNSATCNTTTVSGIYSACAFSLIAATGTWTMDISSAGLYAQIQNISVQTNISTGVPNGATNPTWATVGNKTITLLNNTTTFALVSGHIYTGTGGALSGIKVIDGNGRSATSTSAGLYNLVSSTGLITLTANPMDGSMNHSYITQARTAETFLAASLYDNRDFTLELGGIIKGYFQTSSNTPLPGRVANAQKTTGTDSAQGASDSSGYFYLQNLSTGTYTVTPALDTLETASPTSLTVTLASTGTTTTVSTFTITSGIAEITGQVLIGASSAPVTTGALIIASTSTIVSALPPGQNGATGVTCNPCYYSVSSDATGNYTLQVRSSATPYKVYGWYSTVAGATSAVSKSAMYTVSVSTPGQIMSQNITW